VAIRENWRLELAMSIFQVLNVTFAQHTTSSSKRRPPQSSPVVVVRVYDDGGESAVLQPVISRLADPDEWFDEEEAGGGDMLLPFFKMLLEEQRANAEDANANNASEALIPVDFLVEKLATLHALRRRLRFFFPHQNQQTPVRTHTQTMALGAGVCATLALAPDAALRDHVVDVLSSPRTRPTIAWLNMFYMAWRVDEQNRPPRLRAIDDATIGGMTDVDTPPRQQQQQTKQKKMQTLTQVRAPPKEQAQSPNEKLIHAPTEEKTDVIVSKEMKGKAQVGAPKEKKEQEDAPKDKKAQEAAPKAKKAREYASKEKKGKAQVARPSREENEDTKKQTETTGKGRRTHRPKGVSAVAVVADATTTTTTVAKTSTSSSSPSSSSSQATLSTSTTAKRFIETLCEWSDLFLEAANIFPSSPPSFSEGNHASDAQAAVARLNLAHAFWLMGDEAHRNRVRTAIHAARLTLADTGEIFLHPLFGLLVNPRELFLEPGSLLRRGEAPVNLLVVDGIVAELTTAFQLADVLRFQRRVEEEGGGQPPLSFNCLLYVFASIVRTSADARLEEARIMAKAGIVDQYDFLKVRHTKNQRPINTKMFRIEVFIMVLEVLNLMFCNKKKNL
jgi:hypothetical protein